MPCVGCDLSEVVGPVVASSGKQLDVRDQPNLTDITCPDASVCQQGRTACCLVGGRPSALTFV